MGETQMRRPEVEQAVRNAIIAGFNPFFDEETISIVFMAKVCEEYKKIIGTPFKPMRRIW